MVATRRLCTSLTSSWNRHKCDIGSCQAKRRMFSTKLFNTRIRTRDGKGSKRDGDPESSWNRVFFKGAIGMCISTPLIAIIQGSLRLNDYRVNYSDAPRPLMPARGVAVAVEDDEYKSTPKGTPKGALSSWILHPFSSSSKNSTDHERPLRLLVVGDSLAAGVGVSKSGVPILPESIARALSKASGGRPVYWTCVGTPGVSTAQIVKDIEEIEPYDHHPKGRQLERIVKEFQIRRRLWQERHERGERKISTDLETNERKEPMNAIVQWWKQMQKRESFDSAEIVNTTRKIVFEWWMQSSIRNTYRQRKQLVEEDLSLIKEIVMKPLSSRLDDDDDDYYYDYYQTKLPTDDQHGVYKEYDCQNDSNPGQVLRLPLVHKGSLFRRPSINPEAASEYDIAVVLTGLNDVKEAFLPYMNSSSDGSSSAQSLLLNLRQVLKALQDKMRGNLDFETIPEKNHETISDQESCNATSIPTEGSKIYPPIVGSSKNNSERQPKTTIRHPLVVVPELPVAPLEIFQLKPLCWFLIPIFRAMENNKRFLASCFPDNVLFVHQPNLSWWTDDDDDEMGIGSIRENIKRERLLLRVTDTVRSGRERIEELMKQYYESKEKELKSKTQYPQNSSICEKSGDDTDALLNGSVRSGRDLGSDLVSVDKMHPNDEGYELWGRHIAAAIIAHWNKDSA